MLMTGLAFFLGLAALIALAKAFLALVDHFLGVRQVDELTDEQPTEPDLPRFRGRK